MTEWLPRDAPRARRRGFIGAYLGWLFDGYETFATVLVARTAVDDLVGPHTAVDHPLYVGAILSTTLVSWAAGGLASGVLADRFGRRRVLLWSILWYAVFAGLTAVSPTYVALIVFRFLTGFGMGAEWGAGSSLVSEISDPRRRGVRIALLQSGFGLGFLVATGAWQVINVGGSADWRWMYLLGVAPALLAGFIRRGVSDPQLWNDSDRRRRDSIDRLARGEAISGIDRELARPLLVQLLGRAKFRNQVAVLLVGALASTLGWWAVSTWIPAFTGQKLGGRVSDLPTWITLVNVAYNLAGVIGYLAMGWLADSVGRKPVITAYFAASVVTTPLLFHLPESCAALIGFAALNGFFTLGQWTWMALYPSEVFPTQIRATAMTVVFNTARLAAAAGALLTPVLITAFGSISTAAIVIGCTSYALGMFVAPFLGPETRGRALPGVHTPTDSDREQAEKPDLPHGVAVAEA
ncbi:MFS transporter [Mycobacterium intracellulare]|uniref:MFS transporter n=1 Tax=Mycobacterium intracellulare TaxID=1767 RepID=UPI001EEE422C|nr:MFS transporter [Mycobacterium intracellulare]MEE3750860.1 MFS transporter [Mycobacterium intracellulare]